MNIWVIGRSYPLPINNMQGSFELEQAKMLAKHGHKVSYIACIFHPFKKVKKWGYAVWTEDNVMVHTYSQLYAIERMKLHLEKMQTMIWRKQLSRVEAASGTPDVIHVHYPANITIAGEVLKYQQKGTRVICTEHWSQVLRKVIDRYETRRLTEYVTHADAFLCVGPTLKKAVQEITGTDKELFVLPNIVNDLFMPIHEKESRFTFVSVGVLFPHKQIDKIIGAYLDAFGSKSDIGLTIVGDGPEAGKLHKLAKGSESIRFTGKLDRKATAQIVGRSHALICYSTYETFGVPIIEAWGCGIPVIGTTAAAVMDNWDDRLGIQVNPDRTEDLKAAMLKVHQDYRQYNSEYICEQARLLFSEDVIYKKLMSYYMGNGGSEN